MSFRLRTLPLPYLLSSLALAQTAGAGLETPTDAPAAGPEGVQAQLQWGDYDGDGLQDAIAVTPTGAVTLLRNAGDGSFQDTTQLAGLDGLQNASLAVWKDYDADGDLDLFVGTLSGAPHLMQASESMFTDVTAQSGILVEAADLAAHWTDYDSDGRLDLHLHSAGANTMYHAVATGGFEAIALPTLRDTLLGGNTRIEGDTELVGGPLGGGSAGGGAAGSVDITVSGGNADKGTPGAAPGVGVQALPNGGQTAAAGVAGGPSATVERNILRCVESIQDVNGGDCLEASAQATLGMLYPLTENLFVENGTGRVGIGTISPQRNLHVFDGPSGVTPSTNASIVVESSSEASMSFIAPATEEQSIFFGNSNSQPNAGAIVFNPFGLGGSPLPNGLILRTDDTNRLAITEDGRIGVGTISPERNLHVFDGPSGVTPSTNASLVVESDSEASMSFIAPATEEQSIFFGNSNSQPNAGAIVFNPFGLGGSPLPNGLILRTDDTNRLAITEDGRIGVGTISPERNLHVFDGSSGVTPSTNASLVVESDSEASMSFIAPATEEQSIFFGNSNSQPNAGAIVFNPFGLGGSPLPNGLVLRTDDTNRISITEGGDVGVGTIAPEGALHVVDGDTGVTPNANSKLVVEGNAGGANYVSILGDTGEDLGILFGNSNSSADAGVIWREAADRLLFRAGDNQTRMTVRRSGNVGIGTETPERNLHVFDGDAGISPSTNSSLVVESSGEASISLIAPSSQEQAIFFGNSASAPNAGAILFNPFGVFGSPLPNGLILRTNDTNRLAITQTGNIGVNTLSPSFTFEVNGSAGKPGGGSWSVSSDARLKKNVEELDGALDTLLALRGVTYEYKDPQAINELDGERTGFIAQEVEVVMPDWVEEVDGYKRLTIRGFEALSVEAFRELEARNAELEARVAQLEAIENEMAMLQAMVAELAETR